MAKNDNISKAELYREERKQRIAKANKKNAKGLAAGKAAASVGKKIISIILVLAIVAGLGYVLFQNTGIVKKNVTAVKVGDHKIDAVEFNYLYSTIYQQTAYYADYYAQMGYNMGYNSAAAPDDPSNMTTDEDGNQITFADSFEKSAIDRAQYLTALYNEAVKENYTLSDDDKAQINETVENYKSSAAENSFSLNAYLKANFCPGFNEKTFRKLLEIEIIAQNFVEQKKEEFNKSVSKDYIEKEYKDNQPKYDYATLTYYAFRFETLTGKEGEKEEDLAKRQTAANKKTEEEANAVLKKITDLDSFKSAVKSVEKSKADKDAEFDDKKDYTTRLENTQYNSVSSSVCEDAAKWALDAKRSAGDKKLFKDDSGCYIVFVETPAFASNSVDVRHLLVKFDNEDGEEVTDEMKATAKADAEKILKEFKAGDKTEESFAALATEKTEDDGSKENGGLYEGIRRSDTYVKEFLDWSFDSSRKPGDCEIVETEFGYHIMYFVKNNTEDTDWENTIRTQKGSDDYAAYEEALLADDGEYAATASEFWCDLVKNDFCKRIRKNLALQAKSN